MKTLSDESIKEIVPAIRRIVRSIYLDSKNMTKRFGITGPQAAVLRNLYNSNGSLSSAELSRMMLVSPANITGIIDRLEKKELVVRVRKEGDRRVSLIELTDAGRQKSSQMPDPIEEKIISGLGDMNSTEVNEFKKVLNSLVDMLDAQEVGDGPLDPDT